MASDPYGNPDAGPDCDDGWLKYAHELDAALKGAGFTREEGIVLREVFAQIYGPARRPLARVSPTRLAARTGRKKQNISRACKWLVRDNVLHRVERNVYGFNKRYTQWSSDGEPRFTPQEIEWIASSPAVAMLYMSREYEGIPILRGLPADAIENADGELSSNLITNCHHPRLQNVITADDKTSSPLMTSAESNGHPVIKSDYVSSSNLITNCHHPRLQNVITADDKTSPPYPPSIKTGDLRQETDSAVAESRGGDGGPADIESTRSKIQNDPAEVRRVADWSGEQRPTEYLSQQVNILASSYAIQWVEWAFQSALVNAPAGKTARYAARTLQRWHVAGGPEFAAEERAKAEQRAAAGPTARGNSATAVPPSSHEARMAAQRAIADRRRAERERESQNERL